MNRTKIFIFLFLFWGGQCFAFQTYVRVSQTKVPLHQKIRLTLVIENGSGNETFEVPKHSAFSVKNTLGPSYRTSIINGRRMSSVSYEIILIPKREGKHIFPGILVISGTKRRKTQAIQFEILAPQSRAESNDIIVELKLDKKTLYVDEAAILNFRVLVKPGTPLRGNLSYEKPDLSGFIFEMLKEQPDRKRLFRNGMEYESFELPYVIYPSYAGQLKIGSAQVSGQMIKRSNRRRRHSTFGSDPFFDSFFQDSFFGGGSNAEPFRLESSPIDVSVLELPQKNRPIDFSGTVGLYELEVDFSKSDEIKQGDAVTMTMIVRGLGHIGSISEPVLKNLSGFKVFQDTEVKTYPMTLETTGRKVFKKILIPQKPGIMKFPDVHFNFFNPEKQIYKKRLFKGQKVTVLENKNIGRGGIISAKNNPSIRKFNPKNTLELTGQDILFIETRPFILLESIHVLSWPFFFAWTFFWTLCMALSHKLQGQRLKTQSDLGLSRHKLAFKGFKKDLALIKQKAGLKEQMAVMNLSMARYLSHKLNLPEASIDSQVIDQRLIPLGVPKQIAENLRAYFEQLEIGQFGLVDIESHEWKSLQKKIAKSFKELEGLKIWPKS